MAADDPFLIDPELWFALLCEGFRRDESSRFTFERVVSQFRLQKPPEGSGIPAHAHVRAFLAVGLIGGMGEFVADVSLENPDSVVVWAREEPWTMRLTGGARSAILLHQFEEWITEPGTYRFWVRVRGRSVEWPVRFEVAEQIGPARHEPQ